MPIALLENNHTTSQLWISTMTAGKFAWNIMEHKSTKRAFLWEHSKDAGKCETFTLGLHRNGLGPCKQTMPVLALHASSKRSDGNTLVDLPSWWNKPFPSARCPLGLHASPHHHPSQQSSPCKNAGLCEPGLVGAGLHVGSPSTNIHHIPDQGFPSPWCVLDKKLLDLLGAKTF